MSVEKKDMILTVAGLRKLERELEYLKMVKRREVAERIKQAIEFGDITDSSEYEDAKNEQAFIEGRIITLEKALRNAKVIDAEDVGTEEVGIGSTVRLKDLNGGEELQYTIVGSMESDPRSNKISDESPVGRAMLGQRVGNIVEIQVPAGTLKYQIIDITRSEL
ncbi:transcription elongation factor GreA [Candidatus Desulforudis audaxviator MP104C]|uniref:Transcription elongation factor GreA n=2 Tax=Candidatus Desulforudis TaxID=471826 RepID=B1I1H3_DESAP|nr:transcription elongation factor GreA [Candidatus Desulforudis audaxviator MP104C]AZK58698.1 Transcription elongation factor GreA [Candidatus Desulforudis audaxviator]